jgi:hypothetical protein
MQSLDMDPLRTPSVAELQAESSEDASETTDEFLAPAPAGPEAVGAAAQADQPVKPVGKKGQQSTPYVASEPSFAQKQHN